MNNDFFKEITGKNYQEYAQYMTESRRILLDNIFKLKKEGEISEELYKKLINGVSEHCNASFKNPLDVIIEKK